MKIKPLADRVLVKPTKEDDKTKGGIYIPDSAKEKKNQGKVIAVGPGKRDDSGKLIPMDVKEGDVILYKEYGGTEVTIDGDKLMLLDSDDILGIIVGGN